ncbi:hypothetical protein HAP47_0031780 [Bradyrhizobium sp. 41S5]|uniref:hypothetical protein n=1 Tax=Bradyrhizobium sp. 41S5 TaxID=1404443 RepID=UPI00156BACC5|nr:hypothetical protein [Bradyrhizobium sp. 41S5]UFX43762.1 hypothetical protein HAP47_0031780 [Bradyrhizobium sp. 41S5]
MTVSNYFDPRWDGASIPSEHWHLHRRLLERYGIVLAPGEFAKFATDIRKRRAHLVEERPDGTAVYCAKVDSAGIYVFIGTKKGKMVTILPASDSLKRKTFTYLMRLRASRSGTIS